MAKKEDYYDIPEYEGGDDLSQYRYELPEFSSDWDKKTDKLTNKAIDLTYDKWLTGKDYKALQNRYTYLGKRAMQDTLGQVASRTGGLASSYAGSASQQSYNDYMTRLQDVARDMYSVAKNEAINNAQMAGSMLDRDWNMYQGGVGLDLDSRGFNMGINNNLYDRYMQESNLGLTTKEMNYNRQYDIAMLTGDFSQMSNYGWTKNQISKAEKQWKLDQLAGSSGRSGGGRGRSRGRGRGSGRASYEDQYGVYVDTPAYSDKYFDEGDFSSKKEYNTFSEYQNFLHQGSQKYNEGATVDQVSAWFEKYVMPSTKLSDKDKERLAKALGLLGLSEEEKKGETNYSGTVNAYNY